jgi:hypothetical protein
MASESLATLVGCDAALKFSTFIVATVKSVGRGSGIGGAARFAGACAPTPAALVRKL